MRENLSSPTEFFFRSGTHPATTTLINDTQACKPVSTDQTKEIASESKGTGSTLEVFWPKFPTDAAPLIEAALGEQAKTGL